jgi:putative spermidine/putrescine transport system permease protein
MHRTSQKMPPLMWAVTLTVTAFMLAPMLLSILAGVVVNYSQGISSGFTTRWLLEVWTGYGNTVLMSLFMACACVVLALVLGVPCAYALARSRSAWARHFEELLTLPVAIPGLASALALLLAYGSVTHFRQSFAFILVGHVIFTLPFMVRMVGSAFRRQELVSLEEAARSLGASFCQRFVGILVPAVLPAIVAACLMVFTLSVGEFNLTWMLHTPLTRTLPVGLADSYASMRLEIGSAYTIIFLIVILPVMWALQAIGHVIEKHYGK